MKVRYIQFRRAELLLILTLLHKQHSFHGVGRKREKVIIFILNFMLNYNYRYDIYSMLA